MIFVCLDQVEYLRNIQSVLLALIAQYYLIKQCLLLFIYFEMSLTFGIHSYDYLDYLPFSMAFGMLRATKLSALFMYIKFRCMEMSPVSISALHFNIKL